jgi:hypothetical protein
VYARNCVPIQVALDVTPFLGNNFCSWKELTSNSPKIEGFVTSKRDSGKRDNRSNRRFSKQSFIVRDFRLPPQFERNLPFSGLLRRVGK